MYDALYVACFFIPTTMIFTRILSGLPPPPLPIGLAPGFRFSVREKNNQQTQHVWIKERQSDTSRFKYGLLWTIALRAS